MKLKLVVTSTQGKDEFFAADNWKVENPWTGNPSAGQRTTGTLRVDWETPSPTGAPVKLTKVYAPGCWLIWESLPE